MDYPLTKSNFVTPEDFKNAWGIDLQASMRDGLSPDAFLARIERQLKQFVEKTTFRSYSWGDLEIHSAWREAMQMAILSQAYYVYRNSDIATDSGYDPDKGVLAPAEKLRNIVICAEAYDYLHNAGILNRTLPKYLGKHWDF